MTHNIIRTLPVAKRIFLPLLNLVGEKSEFRIVVTSPSYREFKVLWGLITYEEGEKKEFVIRGTDNYINSIVSSLEMNNLNTLVFRN